MNFFTKQISTIFFSLFSFILSAEAWGGDVIIDAMATCSTSATPCSGSICTTANQVENFKDTKGTIYGTYRSMSLTTLQFLTSSKKLRAVAPPLRGSRLREFNGS